MIRTIGELIAELQKWPADGLIGVSAEIPGGIGSSTEVSILSVDGYAGGALDGHDSGVSLKVTSMPKAYPASDLREIGKQCPTCGASEQHWR